MGTPHVLLTGFEPFAGDDTNPSWLLARELHGQHIAGALVQSVQLPCVFGQALTDLQAVILRDKPRLVLALGLAAGRATMSVERVAINVDDARIPDNAGRQPVDRPVHTGAPAALTSAPCPSNPWCMRCAWPVCPRRCRSLPAPLCATMSSSA